MKTESQGLERTGAGRPAPARMVLARSLEEVPNRGFVHVDRRGRVRSPVRYRAIQAATYTAMGAYIAAAPYAFWVLAGPIGIPIGAALSGFFLLTWRRSWRINRAARLQMDGRPEEARPLLERLLEEPLLPRATRAIVEQNLGNCCSLERRYEEALGHLVRARVLHRRRRTVFVHTVPCAIAHTLVNLGRLKEARGELSRSPVPEDAGELVRVSRWGAELHLCMAEGAHDLDEQELYERARVALGMTSSGGLLALLAWAYQQLGDDDMYTHLLEQALDRHDPYLTERLLPDVHTWLEQRRDAVAPPDE